MKKAFIILAHQLPEQLNIFTEQILSDPESEVFIHINKLCENIIPQIKVDDRIHICKNNVEIYWGDDGILRAILNSYKEVLQSPKEFEYVFVCTGQDLLVKTDIDNYLALYPNKVIIEEQQADGDFYHRYIRGRLLYKWPVLYRRKYDFRYHPLRIMRALHYRLTLMGWPIMRKKIEYDTSHMVFYKDWFWCAVPIDIVKYINDFIECNPKYMTIYKDAYIPEEGFITTLLKNGGLGDRLVSLSTTYIKPMRNNHPPILKIDDIDAIECSGCLFARKFDMRVDSIVIEYFRSKFKN